MFKDQEIQPFVEHNGRTLGELSPSQKKFIHQQLITHTKNMMTAMFAMPGDTVVVTWEYDRKNYEQRAMLTGHGTKPIRQGKEYGHRFAYPFCGVTFQIFVHWTTEVMENNNGFKRTKAGDLTDIHPEHDDDFVNWQKEHAESTAVNRTTLYRLLGYHATLGEKDTRLIGVDVDTHQLDLMDYVDDETPGVPAKLVREFSPLLQPNQDIKFTMYGTGALVITDDFMTMWLWRKYDHSS